MAYEYIGSELSDLPEEAQKVILANHDVRKKIQEGIVHAFLRRRVDGAIFGVRFWDTGELSAIRQVYPE